MIQVGGPSENQGLDWREARAWWFLAGWGVGLLVGLLIAG